MSREPRPDTALREELMDRDDLPVADAERALVDIERVHRLTGFGAVLRSLGQRLPCGRARLLDLGTGTGWVPDRVRRWALGRGTELDVVGVDRKLSHLLVGRGLGRRQHRVVADAHALPFRPASFDASLSTLFFHHFEAPANRVILGEMRRVVSRCAVVVDLRRSLPGRLVARLSLRALRLGPVASYDGRVSVDQAWRLRDVRALLGGDGVLELTRRWPFRFSLVLAPASHRPGDGSGRRRNSTPEVPPVESRKKSEMRSSARKSSVRRSE